MSKYNRTYHLPYSKGATSDDKISNDITNILGIDIVITEKLDGENTGMVNNGVYARSHATYTDSPWSKEVRQLHDIKVRGQLDDDVYLFGENMEGIHSIEYSNLESYFYLFGVRDNNVWLSWKSVEEYAYLLDLVMVPVLFKVESEAELEDLVNNLVKEPSDLGGEREGVVVRNSSFFLNKDFKSNVFKWVRKDHVKTDEHWTRRWKKAKIKR